MKTRSVANLGTIDGREAYRSYWRDLVIDRRTPIIPSLFHLWQTARRGGSFDIVSRDEAVSVAHPLGLRSGTRLFMEEIVVRRYFNNVQALVYLGAVVLLIFLALRFAGALSEEVALIGVGIEVLMLLMLFAVLFYSPEEVAEATEPVSAYGPGEDTIGEVLREIEEIGSTYAAHGMRIERLGEEQSRTVAGLTRAVDSIQGLENLADHGQKLDRTNELLAELVGSISAMNERIDLLTDKELTYRVRRELERGVGQHLGRSDAERSSPAKNDAA